MESPRVKLVILPSGQKQEVLLWIDEFLNNKKDFGKVTVHGHAQEIRKHPTKTAFRIAARFETLCLFPGIAAVS